MLIREGRIRVPNHLGEATAEAGALHSLIVLLFSYVHMTNNRLGASLSEEVSMAYLISRSLEPQRAVV